MAHHPETNGDTSEVNMSEILIPSNELYPQSMTHLTELINQWKEDPEKVFDHASSSLKHPFVVSIDAIKNGRRKMEDRHIVLHDLNKTVDKNFSHQYSYYAVFDGHAGADAASYTTAHLHHHLIESYAFADGDIIGAFREAFSKTDLNYLTRSLREGIKTGSTALCALIEDKSKMYIAWCGDSQAILVRNGQWIEIMDPHKPEREDEKIRIEEMGGAVTYLDTWRVNGTLAVSRAIGDPEHKPCVTSVPDVNEFVFDGTEDFLILACDGLWDQLTPEEATTLVYQHLCENGQENPFDAALSVSSRLSQHAKNEGSSDNITTIVIFFKDIPTLMATPFEPLSLKENSLSNAFQHNGQLNGNWPNNSPFFNFNSSQCDFPQSMNPFELSSSFGIPSNGSDIPTPPIDDVMNNARLSIEVTDSLKVDAFSSDSSASPNPFSDYAHSPNYEHNIPSESKANDDSMPIPGNVHTLIHGDMYQTDDQSHDTLSSGDNSNVISHFEGESSNLTSATGKDFSTSFPYNSHIDNLDPALCSTPLQAFGASYPLFQTPLSTAEEQHAQDHIGQYTEDRVGQYTEDHAEQHTEEHAEEYTEDHAEEYTEEHAEENFEQHTEEHIEVHADDEVVLKKMSDNSFNEYYSCVIENESQTNILKDENPSQESFINMNEAMKWNLQLDSPNDEHVNVSDMERDDTIDYNDSLTHEMSANEKITSESFNMVTDAASTQQLYDFESIPKEPFVSIAPSQSQDLLKPQEAFDLKSPAAGSDTWSTAATMNDTMDEAWNDSDATTLEVIHTPSSIEPEIHFQQLNKAYEQQFDNTLESDDVFDHTHKDSLLSSDINQQMIDNHKEMIEHNEQVIEHNEEVIENHDEIKLVEEHLDQLHIQKETIAVEESNDKMMIESEMQKNTLNGSKRDSEPISDSIYDSSASGYELSEPSIYSPEKSIDRSQPRTNGCAFVNEPETVWQIMENEKEKVENQMMNNMADASSLNDQMDNLIKEMNIAPFAPLNDSVNNSIAFQSSEYILPHTPPTKDQDEGKKKAIVRKPTPASSLTEATKTSPQKAPLSKSTAASAKTNLVNKAPQKAPLRPAPKGDTKTTGASRPKTTETGPKKNTADASKPLTRPPARTAPTAASTTRTATASSRTASATAKSPVTSRVASTKPPVASTAPRTTTARTTSTVGARTTAATSRTTTTGTTSARSTTASATRTTVAPKTASTASKTSTLTNGTAKTVNSSITRAKPASTATASSRLANTETGNNVKKIVKNVTSKIDTGRSTSLTRKAPSATTGTTPKKTASATMSKK